MGEEEGGKNTREEGQERVMGSGRRSREPEEEEETQGKKNLERRKGESRRKRGLGTESWEG